MKSPEIPLHDISVERVRSAVQAQGRAKALAIELGMSDVEFSRLINDHLPKACRLMAHLGLEVVASGHVADLKRVLKEVL